MRFRTKLVLWHAGIVLITLVAFRLASVTSPSGTTEAIARKPSHLISYSQSDPRGSSAARVASIGG